MRKDEIWFFIFIFGLLLFSWPFMSIFEDSLISYLFTAWLFFISIIGITASIPERDGGER